MKTEDDEAPPLATKLAHYANLIGQHGPKSSEAEQFRRENEDDEEFVELSAVARQLGLSLRARAAR